MNKLIIILLIFLLGLYFVSTYPTYEAFTHKRKHGGNGGYRCPNMLFHKGTDYFLYNTNLATIPGVNPLQFKNLEEYVEFTEWQRRQGIKCPILYIQEAYDTQGNTVYKARPSPTDMHGGLPDLILNDGHNNMNIMPMPNPQIAGMPVGTANYAMPMAGANDRRNRDKFNMTVANDDLMPPRNDESLLLDAGQDDRPYNINSYPAFDGNNQYIGLDTPLDKMFNEAKGSVSPNQMDPNWGGAKYTEALVDSGYYKDNEVNVYVAN